MHILDKIISNFKNNKSLYIGEKITISEHMIQSAMLAEKAKSKDLLVCSCLLHDYGHFIIEDPDELVKNNKDGNHETIGYEYLKNFFKKEVVEPIKRCNATKTNEKTGVRDADTLSALDLSFGHKNFGIYCKVLSSGLLNVGAPVQHPCHMDGDF